MTVLSFFLLFGQALLAGFWITGVATVIDGDTIEIQGHRIRLHGIDAPESSQWCTDEGGSTVRCGQQAALVLDSLLQRQNCRFEVLDTDRYGRAVATCYVGETNVNAWLVREGWALAYRKYSEDYVSAEQQAQSGGRGIWQYQFEEPWAWRRRPKGDNSMLSSDSISGSASVVTEHTVPTDCDIKGNINSKGEHVYHTCASPWYERTRIDESKGERWFCSEEEARQAGWRCAKY